MKQTKLIYLNFIYGELRAQTVLGKLKCGIPEKDRKKAAICSNMGFTRIHFDRLILSPE